MEHIRIVKIDEKYNKYIPDEGYLLMSVVTHTTYSEVVTTPQEFKRYKLVEA